MNVVQRLLSLVKRQDFQPGLLGIITNPSFIIRRALYVKVRAVKDEVVGKVLDYGCGSKPYETLFDKASEYIGIDVQQSGHDHKNSKVDIYFDGKAVPFESGHFDSVVCFEVLEHVFQPEHTLKEMHRVLKPNGRLIVTIPFLWDEHEVPYDFCRYTSFGIADLLARNGFALQQLTKTNTGALSICQLLIEYVYQNLIPGNQRLKRILGLVAIPPFTIASLAIGWLLPRSETVYSNLVIVANKKQD